MSPDIIRKLVLTLVPMILSLSVHEWAHAVVAKMLGDDTAEREDRLTLSPLSHVHPIGTLLLPAINVIFVGGFSFIGFARPVPVNPQNLTRKLTMKTGMILVSVAGPLSNLLLAVVSLGALVGMMRAGVPVRGDGPVAGLLWSMFQINVGLFVFNLLPIPPLDGSRLLPRSFDGLVDAMAPYSMIVLLLVANAVPIGPYLIEPLQDFLLRVFA